MSACRLPGGRKEKTCSLNARVPGRQGGCGDEEGLSARVLGAAVVESREEAHSRLRMEIGQLGAEAQGQCSRQQEQACAKAQRHGRQMGQETTKMCSSEGDYGLGERQGQKGW